jgi:hypothetical protein
MQSKIEHKAEVIKMLNFIINTVYKGYPRQDIKRIAMRGVISTIMHAREDCVDTLDRRLECLYDAAWEIYTNPDF